MAKRRMIDPSIWDDPDIGELPGDAFRMFVGLFSNADDEGRIEADPRLLKKVVFGYREDVRVPDVLALRDLVCKRCASVKLYRVGGKDYIVFLKWRTYQNVPKDKFVPSRLPAPPGDLPPDAPDDEDAEWIPDGYPSDTEGMPKGIIDKVKLNESKRGESRPRPAKAVAHPLPDDFLVTDEMKLWAKRALPGLNVAAATEQWMDAMRSNTTKYRYTDWAAAWRNGMKHALQWGAGGTNGSNRQNAAEVRPTTISGPDRTGLREALEEHRRATTVA